MVGGAKEKRRMESEEITFEVPLFPIVETACSKEGRANVKRRKGIIICKALSYLHLHPLILALHYT